VRLVLVGLALVTSLLANVLAIATPLAATTRLLAAVLAIATPLAATTSLLGNVLDYLTQQIIIYSLDVMQVGVTLQAH
jgi:hypothetical protein